jgi:hypothetical protein
MDHTLAIGSSTVEQRLPHQPKDKGLNPPTPTGTGREKREKKLKSQIKKKLVCFQLHSICLSIYLSI